MKYYKKFEDNTVGFYDEEIHGDILFDITYEDKTITVEKPSSSLGEDVPTTLEENYNPDENIMTTEMQYEEQTIKVPVKTLKPEYHEISDDEWMSLLDGQSQGKEIRILKSGEIGLYTKPVCNEEFIQREFNYDTEKWYEGATIEQQQKYYLNKTMECNKKLNEYKELGLYGSSESIKLEKDIIKYKQKYMDSCHVEALKLNEERDNILR